MSERATILEWTERGAIRDADAALAAAGVLPHARLGFATVNTVLTGIGVAGLILYVSGYYYMLELTLLHKAAALAASGTALLAARAVLLKLVLREEAPHA